MDLITWLSVVVGLAIIVMTVVETLITWHEPPPKAYKKRPPKLSRDVIRSRRDFHPTELIALDGECPTCGKRV